MANSLTITLHMVSSLDGIIARPDNSIAWFETTDNYEKGIVAENVWEFLKTIDCYVMGARTYEHALELSKNYGWAYGDTPTIVLTKRKLPVERKSIELFPGDLDALVSKRLTPQYKNVWVVGGALLSKSFLQAGLADEIRLSILPIILGNGLPFFDHIGKELALHVKGVTAYKNGMVELWYEIKKY